jgi:polysaccharide export outer membrane protein
MRTSIRLAFTFGLWLTLFSCGINSNVMFKAPKDTTFEKDSLLFAAPTEYILSDDDKLTFSLSTNNGEMILQAFAFGNQLANNNMNAAAYEYRVRIGGLIEVPIIGNVKVSGLTVQQCEDTLEVRYAAYYQKPFVQVRVTSQKVIVFPGTGSDAKVIPLTNVRTSLVDVLAQAGGIPDRGKAGSVKIIRKYGNERKVFVLDLSNMEGLKYADLMVQANDYIYVEPQPYLLREVLQDATPVISLLSTMLSVFAIINVFK